MRSSFAQLLVLAALLAVAFFGASFTRGPRFLLSCAHAGPFAAEISCSWIKSMGIRSDLCPADRAKTADGTGSAVPFLPGHLMFLFVSGLAVISFGAFIYIQHLYFWLKEQLSVLETTISNQQSAWEAERAELANEMRAARYSVRSMEADSRAVLSRYRRVDAENQRLRAKIHLETLRKGV